MDYSPVTQQSADGFTPATAIAERTGASHRGERGTRMRIPAGWPLLAVLAVQAVLSLRLVRADTAFEDEAAYLWAGHLEWAHVLHGIPLPQFPSYFSGAPVIYPPIGALADATAYTYALFDLVVLLLALVTAFPKPGGKLATMRPLTILAVGGVLVLAALLLGGSRYYHGIAHTTIFRAPGSDSPFTVLAQSWSWTGIIVITAICGAVYSWVARPGRAQTWLLTLLAGAALLIPAEQASLRTTASLNKHVDLGIWFAAIAAGYAVDRLIAAAAAGNMRTVTCGACVIALCFPVVLGASQSRVFSTSWPNSTAFTAILGPLVDHSTGHLLVEDPSIAEYYLPAGSQWMRWSSTRNIVSRSGAPTGGPSNAAGVVGAGNAGTFGTYIEEGYFSLVALNFADTTSLDQRLAADLRRSHHYRVIEVVPYGAGPAGPAEGEYVIWRYEPQS